MLPVFYFRGKDFPRVRVCDSRSLFYLFAEIPEDERAAIAAELQIDLRPTQLTNR